MKYMLNVTFSRVKPCTKTPFQDQPAGFQVRAHLLFWFRRSGTSGRRGGFLERKPRQIFNAPTESKERAELMQRVKGGTVSMFRNGETQAMQSARNSHMMIEEAYATGAAVLSKYSEQRDHLKTCSPGFTRGLTYTSINTHDLVRPPQRAENPSGAHKGAFG